MNLSEEDIVRFNRALDTLLDLQRKAREANARYFKERETTFKVGDIVDGWPWGIEGQAVITGTETAKDEYITTKALCVAKDNERTVAPGVPLSVSDWVYHASDSNIEAVRKLTKLIGN